MKNIKNTKIVSTIGPSSWSEEVITKLVKEGMNVARINGAFADIDELRRVGDLIRKVSDDIALMLDVKGHEVRLNCFDTPIYIKPGQEIIIGSSPQDSLYPASYLNLYQDIASGQILIIDKGAASLEVLNIENGKIVCNVITGDVIGSGKGMNIPGVILHNPSLTDRDKEQINFVIQNNWDFVAGSFIRSAEDIQDIKNVLGDSKIKIIAKIEDQQGIDNIDSIIQISDGIMIARGDLGSEVPYERLPMIQKELIFKCNIAAKPVITATNMLESMIDNPMPTRAEITDVANAVLDGTDAIMTSGETSNGKYPVETIITMTRIAKEAEKFLLPEISDYSGPEEDRISVAISNAGFEFIAEIDEITKVVIYSKNGITPRLLARLNLPVRIIALVSTERLKRQLNLTKNIDAFVFKKSYLDRDLAVGGIINYSIENGFLEKNDKILLIGNLDFANLSNQNHTNIFEYIDISLIVDK